MLTFSHKNVPSQPTRDVISQPDLEDPLAHLPCSAIITFKKGQIIYDQDKPSTSLYLVAAGRVKLSRVTEDGRRVFVDIYQQEEFFGESAFLGLQTCSEIVIALEAVKVMAWRADEFEDMVARRPRLAIALVQLLVKRSLDFGLRIESLSLENLERRLVRCLIRFSERLGSPGADGSVQMIPLTHELLSQYVGTSREVITQHMNHFRRQGYLNYSRQSIILYAGGLKKWWNFEEVARPEMADRVVHGLTSRLDQNSVSEPGPS